MRELLRAIGVGLALSALVAGCGQDGEAPAAHLPYAETFSEEGDFWLWTPGVGAQRSEGGEGLRSEAKYHQGALLLQGTPETERWTTMTREVVIDEGVEWVLLRGLIRAQNLQPAETFTLNANLYLKTGEGLVATRVITQDTSWVEVRRRIQLPEGTTQVTLGCFASIPGQVWFDDVVLEAVEAPEWVEEVVGHYHYHSLNGEFTDEDKAYNAESLRMVAEFLGVEPPQAVHYYRYPNTQIKEEFTGKPGNAHVEDPQSGSGVIHQIFLRDRHEIVHVLAAQWGDPPALLAEGLAVHLSGGWNGQPTREAALHQLESGNWVAPSEILRSVSFRAHPELLTYPLAGAFVEYLLEVHGREDVEQLYRTWSNQASRPALIEQLQQVLETSPRDLDAGFRAWVLQGS